MKNQKKSLIAAVELSVKFLNLSKPISILIFYCSSLNAKLVLLVYRFLESETLNYDAFPARRLTIHKRSIASLEIPLNIIAVSRFHLITFA